MNPCLASAITDRGLQLGLRDLQLGFHGFRALRLEFGYTFFNLFGFLFMWKKGFGLSFAR